MFARAFFKPPLVCLCFLTLMLVSCVYEKEAKAFSNQTIQKGAVGDDVIELQARLQYIGFYNGKIDGAFGWNTYWALRNFQSKFGLSVDGVAGAATKQKLAKASQYNEQFVKRQIQKGNDFTYYGGKPLEQQVKSNGTNTKTAANSNSSSNGNNQSSNGNDQSVKVTAVNVPSGFSQNDIKWLANAVYGESRGEPYIGQVAVAAVILNRVSSASFPNTVYGVIFEPLAFTAVADGQIWLTPNETSKKAVMDAINGWDPTDGALYYFNPATATSKWIWSRPQIKKIGNHIFCR